VRLTPRALRFPGGVLALAVALVSLAGCEERPPVATPRDAGPRDAGPQDGDILDAELLDGDVLDGDLPDGVSPPFDGGDPSEAGVIITPGMMFDAAAPLDLGPPLVIPDSGRPVLDGGDCLDPSTGTSDPCRCAPAALQCGDGFPECPLGTACIRTGCGTEYCMPAGSQCESDFDCTPGARCVGIYERLTCVRPVPGCSDSRDCPIGHACEPDGGGGRRCVDRRIPCDVTVGCPRGFVCRTEAGIVPFCDRGYQRCNRNGGCFGLSCTDLDGDGLRECGFPDRACAMFGDCPAGTVCALAIEDYRMECGSYGPCRTVADCPAGDECLDLWGDGVKTCEPAGGACAAATCPPDTVCASPAGGGSPTCLARP
jgi:hypothetical protein